MKVLQFEMEQVVSGPIDYTILQRSSVVELELPPRTFKYYKIAVKDLLSPLIIYIKYQDKQSDLKVIYSRTQKRPNEKECEAIRDKPKDIVIYAVKSKWQFVKDTIYFKL